MSNAQHQNFISLYAKAVNSLLDAREQLKAFRERDAAQGLVAALTPDDFAGMNSYLAAADIQAAFAAMDTLEALLTNFAVNPPAPTPALASLLKFRT